MSAPPDPGICSICHRAAAVYGHDRTQHVVTQLTAVLVASIFLGIVAMFLYAVLTAPSRP